MAKKLSKDDRLDLLFRALADRTRRAQLALLAKGAARVSDLAEPFEMSLPAASKHLRVLEAAGLVSRTVDGRVHRCSLRPEPLEDVERWLQHYRPFWAETLDSLAEFVENDRQKKKRRQS